jgi:glycosyltransferase involved in cell wall biosynthesis
MECKYILITAAYNEEQHIARTIESVIRQEILPLKWAIISDGSTDKTDQIIQEYARRFPFIQYLRSNKKKNLRKLFFSKVHALAAAYAALQNVQAEFIGNLDADMVLPPGYYKSILAKFAANPRLGVASGTFEENIHGRLIKHIPPEHQTPGALQVFRRECYTGIGGYPLLDGGEDAAAETMIRMHGWESRSYTDIVALHLKPMGIKSTGSRLKFLFKLGKIDYFLGMHPLFAFVKLIKRIFEPPYFIGGMAILLGFIITASRKPQRNISTDYIRFSRKEQWQRLLAIFKRF